MKQYSFSEWTKHAIRRCFFLWMVIVWVMFFMGCDSDDHPDEKARMFRFGMHSDRSGSEDFIAKTADPAVIDKVLAELQIPVDQRLLHIHGAIDRGNDGYNLSWSWHFIPGQWDLTEMSIEVCDAEPSYVEAHLDEWLSMQNAFCPWDSYVKEEIPHESRKRSQADKN